MVGNTALQKPSVLVALGVFGDGGGGTPPTAPTVSDPSYQAVINYGFAQGFGLPSAAVRTAQDNLVIAMKAAGVWTLLDIFYLFATDADLDFIRINWKSPGNYQLTDVGITPTHTPFLGCTFPSGNFNTGWIPGTNGVNYAVNECGMGMYVNTNNASNGVEMGCSDNVDGTTNSVFLNARNATDQNSARMNSNVSMIASGILNSQGFYHGQRLTSTSSRWLRNASQMVADAASGSTARPVVSSLYIGTTNGAGGTPGARTGKRLGMAWAGASLTGKETAWFQAWNEYQSIIDYKRIIDYANTQSFTLPSAGVQTAQRQLIDDMMNSGVWNQMDIFYNFITDGDLGFSRINWKDPGNFTCTVMGTAPTLVSLGGVQFDVNGNFDTGWLPSTGFDFTQNGAGVYLQVLSTLQSSNYDCGCSANADGVTSGIVFNSAGTTGTAAARINSNTTLSLISGRNEGFWHLRRTASNASSGAKNTVAHGADVIASVVRPAISMYLGASNGNGTPVLRSGRRYGMFAMGSGNATVATNVYTAWNAYSNPYRAAAAYQAILDYAGTQSFTAPASGTQTLQLALIRALMDQGIWDYLDCFYVAAMDGGSLGFSYINWKAPGTFQATASAAPTLTNKVGWAFNGTTQFVDTNWRPNATQGYLTNDAGFGIHVATNAAHSGFDCGCTSSADGTTASSSLNTRNPVDAASMRINGTAGSLAPASTNSIGFWHAKRTGANDIAIFKNGVSAQTSAGSASVSRTPQDMFIGASNGNGTAVLFSPRSVSMFWAGQSCSGREAAFNTAWNTYFTAVSV